MTKPVLSALVGPALAALLLAACGDEPVVRTIERTRTTSRPHRIPDGIRAEVDRFPFEPSAPPRAPSAPTPAVPAHELPPGWELVQAGAAPRGAFDSRLASFRAAAAPGVDVSISWLAGDGGGMVANVARWRRQMGLSAPSPEEVQALPRITVMGVEGVLVEADGAFTPMGAPEPLPGQRLLGAIVPYGGGTLYVKMTGPVAEVVEQRAAFLALCHSLRPSSPDEPAPPDTPAPPDASHAAADLDFAPPPGWTRGAEKPMRLATFHPEDRPDVECAVFVFAGDGGGLAQNVNMWRRQMGLPEAGPEEISALPRITVRGVSAPIVELTGAYHGDQGVKVPDARLIAVMAPLGENTLFLKLVGPADGVTAERERFLQYCGNL